MNRRDDPGDGVDPRQTIRAKRSSGPSRGGGGDNPRSPPAVVAFVPIVCALLTAPAAAQVESPAFSIDSPRVTEGAAGATATLTYTVTLSRAYAEPTTVDWADAGTGAATSGTDYTALSGGTLVFARYATSRTIDVAVTGDAMDEADETVVLVLSNPSTNAALSASKSGAGVIVDDDAAPTVRLGFGDLTSIPENGGTASVSATLSHPSSAATTVTVEPVAGLYTVGRDATISIPAGATSNRSDLAAIRAVDNAIYEGSAGRAVTVTARAANGGGVGPVTGATLTLTDDEAKPTATLALSEPDASRPDTIPENGGTTTVTASLSHASSAATTIAVQARAAAPASADDFSLSANRTLTIAAGATTSAGTVTISANDDALAAPDKSVTVSGVASGGHGVAHPAPVALTIADDDDVLQPGSGDLLPGFDSTIADRSWERAAQIPRLDLPAATGGDGDLTYSLQPALPAGVTRAGRRVSGAPGAVAGPTLYTWTARDADGDEASLTFEIEVFEKSRKSLAAPTLSIDSPRVSEGNGGPKTLTFTVSLSAAVPNAVTVRYVDTGAGTATSGTDYEAVTAGVLTFEANDTSRTFAVTVTGDEANEPDETVEIALNDPSGAFIREAEGTGTGVIVDDDGDPTGCFARALGSAGDGAPSFGDARIEPQRYVEGETVPPLALPAATGGDGDLRYTLTDPGCDGLRTGLVFDERGDGDCGAVRTLCGAPTRPTDETLHTLTAIDADGDTATLTFTVRVVPAAVRSRLTAIGRSILPELSRTMWTSALTALTGRLERPAGVGSADVLDNGLAAASGFLRSKGEALRAGETSWREALGGEGFALSLVDEKGAGVSAPALWGSADWRRLAREDGALEWSGDLFSVHVGADLAWGSGFRGGLAISRYESAVDYTDRGDGGDPVEGVHETRTTAIHPWLGWSSAEGTRLWAAAGFGVGDATVVDVGRRTSDSRFTAGAVGGAARLFSSGATALEAKGSAEATRYDVEGDGTAVEALSVSTRRLRLSTRGSRGFALAGAATLTPSVEAGARWDGGDGATGAGMELGAGLAWSDPIGGVAIEAGGRVLLAHRGDLGEWGASGALRLDPGADGLGLSLGLSPAWGEADSGLSRLEEEGVASREAAGRAGARLEGELGYGLRALHGAVATPWADAALAEGGERRYGVGARFDLGAGFDLGLRAGRRETGGARPEHTVVLRLRMSW